MTPAATPEALAEALAEFQRRNGYHRPEIEELLMEFGELVLATATAEAASLRAEVEALKAARDPRVDTQVWTAAASLEEAQRHQPAWLWFSDGYGPTFGRWAGGPGQAPYVRADIALARAATAGEGA